MSLYDGLSVETAPVTDLYSSSSIQSLPPDEDEPPVKSKKEKSKKTPALPDKNNQTSSLSSDSKISAEKTKTSSSTTSSWSSSSMKLMATNMMRQQIAASKVRTVGRGGVASRGRKPVSIPSSQTTVIQSSLFDDDLAGGLTDEYDPLFPNNYDDIKKAEKDKIREAQNRERENRMEHYKKYSRDSDSDDEEREERKRRKSQKGTAVPPPSFAPPPPPAPTEQPDEEAKVVRSALEELSKLKAPRANPYGKKNFKTSAVASNIMTKYGWQEGQGLGKESQGISTALSVEKTSFKGGKIVNMAAERELVKEEERKMVKSLTEIVKNPTKVILLENMVGAGEVDNELQPEVIEECAKYGEVTNCLIYEIPEGASDDEAVRIFVEFGKKDSAIKAVIDLNGRFFGGRTIRAGFYSEERFSNFDLAPQ